MLNKRIDFLLTGRLVPPSKKSQEGDQEQASFYEIKISPEESFITAKIMSSNGDAAKCIPAELPLGDEEANYMKIFALLFQGRVKPSVVYHGYEKLGNKKLQIVFDASLVHSWAHVTILLQGSSNGVDYQIQLNPLEIGCSTGQILGSARESDVEANLILGGIEHLDRKCLQKILQNLKATNHEVKIEGRTLSLILGNSLKELLDSFLAESVGRTVNSEATQNEDEEFLVYQDLDDNFVTNYAVLEVLKNTLERFQIMQLQLEMKRAKGEDSAVPVLRIDPLQWDQLPRMVALLTDALREVDRESDFLLVCQQLELLIGLLHAMAVLGVDRTDQFVYEEAYTAILYFAEEYHPFDRYFIIDYLSQLGKQALFLVPDRAFKTPAQGCKLSLFIRLISDVFEEDWKKEPWSLISGLIDKAGIENLCSWEIGKGRWLADLCIVQRMVWESCPQIFVDFVEAIQTNLQAIQQTMDLHNPYFVYGLAAFLWKVVNWAEFQTLDQMIQHNAIKLLKMISLNNATEDLTLPFNLSSKNLRQGLLNTMEAFLGCWDNRIRTKIFVTRALFHENSFFRK